MMRNLAEAMKDAPPVVHEVFESIAAALAPSAAHSPDTSLRFDIVDGKRWRIAIERGRIVCGESATDADCVLEMREETLRAILEGDQNARTAMLSGKVKMRGDRAIANRLLDFAASQPVAR
ncbi:MAG TPA: SCP2 sterol-binding domain-containing protein [Dehalococcoidia bacterium]